MTKKELAEAIGEQQNISHAEALRAINMVVDGARKAIQEGNVVTFRGFGSFERVLTAKRSGRNLRTGERVEIPPKFRVKFKNYMDDDSSVED